MFVTHIWKAVLYRQTKLVIVILVPAVEQRLLLFNHQPTSQAVDPEGLSHSSKELIRILKHVPRKIRNSVPNVFFPHWKVLYKLFWSSKPVVISNIY